jgi:hypothetical protein
MERTLQCYREDERVERPVEATLRDIEFGHCDDSPTRRRQPELLTQFGAKEKPAWHPTIHLLFKQGLHRDTMRKDWLPTVSSQRIV